MKVSWLFARKSRALRARAQNFGEFFQKFCECAYAGYARAPAWTSCAIAPMNISQMIVMKPRWYETCLASRAISNFLALSEKVKRANHKRKTSRRCELTVHELMTESLRCCLMGNPQKYIVSIHVNVSNFQKFAFLEKHQSNKIVHTSSKSFFLGVENWSMLFAI